MQTLKTTSLPPLPAVPPLLPSRGELLRLRFLLFAFGWVGRLLLRKFVRGIEVQGKKHLRGGPKLVLMNHSNPLDPLILTFYGRTVAHLLVTEPFMAKRAAARFTSWLGQIPKRKLDNDTVSIRTMKQWCAVGGVVGTFPEGQFSWDGYPLPLQPGLAQLVRFLDVPVVIARLTNGDRLWPAWARHPRRTRLKLEFDPPKKFEVGEDIESYISEKIHVNPDRCERFPVEGENLAEGLAQFLRLCLKCGTDGKLQDDGDRLRCKACANNWEVTPDGLLRASDEADLRIADAWSEVRSLLKKQWANQPTLFSLSDVVVYDATKPQWAELASGVLNLSERCLKVADWSLELSDLLAHTMDWGDLILLRTKRKRYALRMSDESRAIWTFALEEAIKNDSI